MNLRVALRCVVLVAVVGLASCSTEKPRPIFVEGRTLTVQNLSGEGWENVEVWMNNHYRVTKRHVAAGERLGIPLDAFVAGFGQRFNPARQVVQGIEVTATTASGQPIRLTWGEGRRR